MIQFRMLVLLALAACVVGAAAPVSPVVAQIVAQERAFAADARVRGASAAFRENVAPDAVGFRPDEATGDLELINAHDFLFSRPARPGPTDILWWPSFSGAARSADMGFTLGPVVFAGGRFGTIFTVWTRQPDGRWKFFFDGGPPADGQYGLKPDDPVQPLPISTARPVPPEDALAEVARLEAGLAAAAAGDRFDAWRPFVTPLTRVMGSGGQPATGWPRIQAELSTRAGAMRLEPLGSRASAAGDLVFTYGWASTPSSARGAYARVWQRTRKGWGLIVDQVQVQPKAAAS
jgi:hypothetical protein